MVKPFRISLKRIPRDIAATPDGLILILLSEVTNESISYELVCFNNENKLIWQRQLSRIPLILTAGASAINYQLCITNNDRVWLGADRQLEQYDVNGSVTETIQLNFNDNETLAGFLVNWL
jgi:hypothetical protein